jgi:hypothetical protein
MTTRFDVDGDLGAGQPWIVTLDHLPPPTIHN